MKRKALIRPIAAGCCLLVCLVLVLTGSGFTGMLQSQRAAERWGTGDIRCAQVSVFLTEEAYLSPDTVPALRESVDSALTAASIGAASEDARIWYSAYSTQTGTAELSGTRPNPATAAVTAVGGDFFTLHRMQLASGGYFYDTDLMQDKVVLDTQLAWQLFGSADAAGMQVTVNGTDCIVAGVVEPETDYASKTAYGDMPRLYIPYALYESWQGEYGDALLIGCYEAVLPNPVRGFAVKTVTDAVGETGSTILENTGRFSVGHRWQTLTHLHDMLVFSQNPAYPYWENAARIVSFDLALLLGAEILLLVWPVLYGLRLLWKGYRRLGRFLAEKHKARKRRFRTIPEESAESIN